MVQVALVAVQWLGFDAGSFAASWLPWRAMLGPRRIHTQDGLLLLSW